MKVAVLKGGISSEREVSLVSGTECAKALRSCGYDVTEIDVTRDLWCQLEDAEPDVIFNALHGDWGEDGRVQGVLDMYGKPYTHSGVMASALAMDKHRAKYVLKAVGITVADGGLYDRVKVSQTHPMKLPYVVKPNGQGSSKSVYIIQDENSNMTSAIAEDKEMGNEVIVEAFVPGRELTVTVMGERALAVTEIIPQTDWYDYEAKYAKGGLSMLCPPIYPMR